jgi:hypothetical protein
MAAQDMPTSADAGTDETVAGGALQPADDVVSAAPAEPGSGGVAETLIPVTGAVSGTDAALRVLPPLALLAILAFAGWRRVRSRH